VLDGIDNLDETAYAKARELNWCARQVGVMGGGGGGVCCVLSLMTLSRARVTVAGGHSCRRIVRARWSGECDVLSRAVCDHTTFIHLVCVCALITQTHREIERRKTPQLRIERYACMLRASS
jgi:hypothetical protein